MADAVVAKKDWWSAIGGYLTPRMLVILAMGFASGLPLLLTLSTLSFWLSKVGVDKTTIGLFALVGAPYTFKFLWSPIIDQAPLPILTRLLGRRRSWLLLIQALLAVAIFAMGFTDPAVNPLNTAVAALVVAFLSASQDIVIDAYRIDLLPNEEQGQGAGATQIGYRFGLLLAGAGALSLSDYFPWPVVFTVLAAAMVASMVVTLFAPEPPEPVRPANRSYLQIVKEAVIDPFLDFMKHSGWLLILAFTLFYKYGDALSGTMANPFYNEMGFTGTEIGVVSKIWGVWMTVVGAVVGGIAVVRWGMFPALMVGGILQALTNLAFSYVAMVGHDLPALAIAITADNIAGGAAGAALVAYLSSLCNIAYSATQYALLTSFMAWGRTLMSSPSGWLADHTDWPTFWAVSVLLAIPGLILLAVMWRYFPYKPAPHSSVASVFD